MIKITAIFLWLVFAPLSAAAAIITASNDYVNSGVITDEVIVNLDFGVSGRLIGDVTVDLTFSDNLWDPNESVTLTYRIESSSPDIDVAWVGSIFTIANDSGSSLDNYNSDQTQAQFLVELAQAVELGLLPASSLDTSTYIRNLYIDNDGLAFFGVSSSGDGINISNISVTAELATVPLPGGFMLFVSGLGLLMFRSAKNNSNTSC